jgi:hypothetical protein
LLLDHVNMKEGNVSEILSDWDWFSVTHCCPMYGMHVASEIITSLFLDIYNIGRVFPEQELAVCRRRLGPKYIRPR